MGQSGGSATRSRGGSEDGARPPTETDRSRVAAPLQAAQRVIYGRAVRLHRPPKRCETVPQPNAQFNISKNRNYKIHIAHRVELKRGALGRRDQSEASRRRGAMRPERASSCSSQAIPRPCAACAPRTSVDACKCSLQKRSFLDCEKLKRSLSLPQNGTRESHHKQLQASRWQACAACAWASRFVAAAACAACTTPGASR